MSEPIEGITDILLYLGDDKPFHAKLCYKLMRYVSWIKGTRFNKLDQDCWNN